jgi:hypothetical protein
MICEFMMRNSIYSKEVIIFVSNTDGLNTGKGGHYYTALDHYRAIETHLPCRIVCIGHEIPSALRQVGDKLHFIKCKNSIDELIAIRSIRKIISSGEFVGNAFDSNSFLFARIAGIGRGLPLMFTKCGGAVRKGYTPANHPDIVFHDEDYDFYKKQGAPTSGRFFEMIPNRVFPHARQARDYECEPIFQEGHIKILRIARICKKYKESIEQSINLTRALLDRGILAQLAIVGYPQDPNLVEYFEQRIRGIGQLFLNEIHTENASKYLAGADIVVATGRGAMESALAHKVTLVTSAGEIFPTLLDKRTLVPAMRFNFSERFILGHENDSLSKIEELIGCKSRLAAHVVSMAHLSHQHFSLDSVVGNYIGMYESAVVAPSVYSLIDILRHYISLRIGKFISFIGTLKMKILDLI